MYGNIGRKIKVLAEVIALIGIISSIAVALFFFFSSPLIGMFIIIGGAIVSWINCLLIYGFGQLIENSDIIVEILKRLNEQNDYL